MAVAASNLEGVAAVDCNSWVEAFDCNLWVVAAEEDKEHLESSCSQGNYSYCCLVEDVNKVDSYLIHYHYNLQLVEVVEVQEQLK